MLGILERLADLDKADPAVLRSDNLAGALLGGVFDPEVDRIDSALLGQFVHHTLRRERGVGRAGSPVGGGFGPVDDHIVAVDQEVGDVVGRDHAHRAGTHRRTRKSAGLERQQDFRRGNFAVLGGAHLDLHPGARGRTGGAQNFGAGHHQLYRMAGLSGQQQRDAAPGRRWSCRRSRRRSPPAPPGCCLGEPQQQRAEHPHLERSLGRAIKRGVAVWVVDA